jgi:hypothetical protein
MIKPLFMKSIKKEHPNKIVYQNEQGLLHRTDGPAIEWNDGTKEWYINGQRHRTDRPAIEWSIGTRSWWINGKFHRVDGHKSWFINGMKYTEQEWQEKTIKIKLERLKSYGS